MKYQLIIFDMDGTILDTLEDLADSLNDTLKRHGYSVRTREEVRSFVGNGIRKLVERGVGKPISEEELNCLCATQKEYYSVHCADKTKPYDGILELLRQLRQSGYKTAVVSNKADYAVQNLVNRYFEGLFDLAIGEKPSVQRKPAPDSVNEVINQLQMQKDKVVYIGDSDVDIQTAHNAGIDCIAVDWGFREREFLQENGAKQIASTVSELRALIESE